MRAAVTMMCVPPSVQAAKRRNVTPLTAAMRRTISAAAPVKPHRLPLRRSLLPWLRRRLLLPRRPLR
jgi:hypothetical protein